MIPESIWNARDHGGIKDDLWRKYRYELFGLVSSLVGGEAKQIMNSMLEDGEEEKICGFRVLWLFKKRWSVQTFSTRLQAFLKVVNPPEG